MLICDLEGALLTIRPEYRGIVSKAHLFNVFKRFAVEKLGLSETDALTRLRRVVEQRLWWSWHDVMLELGCTDNAVWDYAAAVEREYLGPAEPRLAATFAALKAAGVQTAVAADGPPDGIDHLLRLAGLRAANFDRVFTSAELKAMKAEPLFWQRLAAKLEIPPGDLAVAGTDFDCDCAAPATAGIPSSFLLDRDGRHKGKNHPGMRLMSGLSQIVKLLPCQS